jgi:hypothetical protein
MFAQTFFLFPRIVFSDIAILLGTMNKQSLFSHAKDIEINFEYIELKQIKS